MLNSVLFRHVHKIVKSSLGLLCLFILAEQLGSHWTDFHEIWCLQITWIYVEQIRFDKNLSSITCILNDGLRKFMKMSCWIPFKMRNVSDESCRENQNTHFMLNNFFLKIHVILWDDLEKYRRARQATDDACDTEKVICVLDFKGKNRDTQS